MQSIVEIGISLLAFVVGVYAIVLAVKSQKGLDDVARLAVSIRDIVIGRSHFTEMSVYINHNARKGEAVWHITDTLSIDRKYYDYFKHADKKDTQRITFFAPLRHDEPVIVGAVIRKSLAPNITIRNLPPDRVEALNRRFPFKCVLCEEMILVSNERIGSHHGSAFAHFTAVSPNTYAEFVRGVYRGENIEAGQTFEKWVEELCQKRGLDIATASSDDIKKTLVSESTINTYIEKYDKDNVAGLVAVNKAFEILSRHLKRRMGMGTAG